MAALAPAPAPQSLYQLEESLTALLDTEELVPIEQRAEFAAELGHMLASAADKRDRVAQFLAHLEKQQDFAAAEIARLQALKQHYARVEQELENYVVWIIVAKGKDAKGKYPKLEGHTSLMWVQKNPDSVEITDAGILPTDYQRVNVTLPAAAWEDVLNLLPGLARDVRLEPDKTAIKAALTAGLEVPGARLVTDKMGLRRK